jgi:hypothetical protein
MVSEIGLPLVLMSVGISSMLGIVLAPMYWLLSKPVVGSRIDYVSGLVAAVLGLAVSTLLAMTLAMAVPAFDVSPTFARPALIVVPLAVLSAANVMLIRTVEKQRITLKQAFVLQAMPVIGLIGLFVLTYRSPY